MFGGRFNINESTGRVAAAVSLWMASVWFYIGYLGSAMAYSATLGVSAQRRQTEMAGDRALLYFCLFLLMECRISITCASWWELSSFSSRIVRAVFRYGLAAIVAALLTVIAAQVVISVLRL
jgi:hypothetical protein